MDRPILGITMGDPASIGPEIAAKALADPSVCAKARPFVIGDRNCMADALRITKLSLRLAPIAKVAEARKEWPEELSHENVYAMIRGEKPWPT
jgi:4-hydroxythreonine-4-phosphate dehydrogenase